MPTTVIKYVIAILILAAGGLYLRIYGEKPDIETDPGNVNTAALVKTATVEAYSEPLIVNLDGEASTYRVITVSAQVAGKIIEKPNKIRGGNYVMPGEILFEIEPVTYQLEVDRLDAQLKQIDAELAGIKVDLENTAELIKLANEDLKIQQANLARVKNLFQRNGSTQSAYEAALKQEIMARNTLVTLENQTRAMAQKTVTVQANRTLVESQKERALVDLARCTVKSPIEGRLVIDIIEEGDYVKAGDTLIQISDASKMEIKCQMLAEELAWVWQAQVASALLKNSPDNIPLDPIEIVEPIPCEVVFEFQGVETIWDGFLDRYEGTGLDRETRTFPCRVVVDNPRKTRTQTSLGGRAAVTPPTLLSGMYVKVRIPVESSIPLLKIPVEAVRPGGTVWLVRDKNLQIIDVSVAETRDEFALIREGEGLQEGAQVVTSPLASVSSGMEVRFAEESEGSDDDSIEKPQMNSEEKASTKAERESVEVQR